MENVTITIGGMTCGHCVASVERAVAGVDGVVSSEVVVGSARVAFDPRRTSAEEIVRAIEEEGHDAAAPAGRE